MKKLLLFTISLCITNVMQAECDNNLPVSEDFSDYSSVITCWSFIDSDNDGYDWFVMDMGGGNNGLKSHSYVGNKNPDNWAISNAINLSSSGNIELSWIVRATAWDFDQENYTVYVANGNQISDFTSSSVTFTENTDNSDASGSFASRSLNISSLAGQTVYVAFRHHNVTNQWELDIDDFQVTSSLLGIEDNLLSTFTHFYNSNNDVLTLKSNSLPMNQISIYNLLGQNAIRKELSTNIETINLSSLKDGIYIVNIDFDNAQKSFKFLKQ